ncbi:hypothetical protein N7471_012607 [Penicillium samsonianum]|uniref:uncharacterized protein n=1 Tax=Penicillium samsonianum TaxID=1882272 RepID=UPI002548F4CB|nr:uncharacterized protein N7471_012607 [Penicillium samsonianum]KAJ6125290.1 hypothetical protein N7471_012607 [Penicillium samsonianum]
MWMLTPTLMDNATRLSEFLVPVGSLDSRVPTTTAGVVYCHELGGPYSSHEATLVTNNIGHYFSNVTRLI